MVTSHNEKSNKYQHLYNLVLIRNLHQLPKWKLCPPDDAIRTDRIPTDSILKVRVLDTFTINQYRPIESKCYIVLVVLEVGI